MKEAITSLLMLSGAIFAFLSALGILRFPDLFSRMQAATKRSA
jgi:multicomponent Na+:H+ antiporter subunit G